MKTSLIVTANAMKWLGVKEKPRNSGFFNKEFEQLMRHTGWITGYPWCASFIRMLFITTFEKMGEFVIAKDMKRILSHGVLNTFRAVKKSKYFDISKEPLGIGSIVFWHTHGQNGHEGLYIWDKSKLAIETIEGNTNSFGSRDGEYVATKSRLKQPKNWELLGYAKFIEDYVKK